MRTQEERGQTARHLAGTDHLDLAGWHLYHAVRADLLSRPPRADEAGKSAIDHAGSDLERRHLTLRVEALGLDGA